MNPKTLLSDISALYNEQQRAWLDFALAVKELGQVQIKTLSILGCSVTVQNNPTRIRSTAAKIDPLSIAERPCFLCEKNRPPEQQGLPVLDGKYNILVNPFPVLPNHFTVVGRDHKKQDIASSLEDFLHLASLVGKDSTIIFNGAKAGASAPDHQHFQFIPSSRLPIFRELSMHEPSVDQALFSFAGANYLLFTSCHQQVLLQKVGKALGSLQESGDAYLECLNLIAWNDDRNSTILLVPRKKHRPNCFFAEGVEQILVSPAAIELSGVWVLPRVEDFEKISAQTIEGVNREVCFSAEECLNLLK